VRNDSMSSSARSCRTRRRWRWQRAGGSATFSEHVYTAGIQAQRTINANLSIMDVINALSTEFAGKGYVLDQN